MSSVPTRERECNKCWTLYSPFYIQSHRIDISIDFVVSLPRCIHGCDSSGCSFLQDAHFIPYKVSYDAFKVVNMFSRKLFVIMGCLLLLLQTETQGLWVLFGELCGLRWILNFSSPGPVTPKLMVKLTL